jgi:hypothetical protein
MKKITIEQVIEGIKAGGYPQGRNHLIEWSSDYEYEGEIVNADAIGIAALNLGLDAHDLLNALMDVSPRKNSSVTLAYFIVELNDVKELGLAEITSQVLVKFKQKLKTEIDVQEGDFTKVTNYKGTIY